MKRAFLYTAIGILFVILLIQVYLMKDGFFDLYSDTLKFTIKTCNPQNMSGTAAANNLAQCISAAKLLLTYSNEIHILL